MCVLDLFVAAKKNKNFGNWERLSVVIRLRAPLQIWELVNEKESVQLKNCVAMECYQTALRLLKWGL